MCISPDESSIVVKDGLGEKLASEKKPKEGIITERETIDDTPQKKRKKTKTC